VAVLAGISVEYYTRLERVNATGVSEDVLDGIARALQLDEAERAPLFDLVRAADTTTKSTRRRPTQERVRPTVQRILDWITAPPTCATDALIFSPPISSAALCTHPRSKIQCNHRTRRGSSS
jgi:transcriptional regulator with XRE-family HTH domain